MNRRKGFQLAEVILAAALAAGPLGVGYGLVRSNAQSAHTNEQHAAARLLLFDVLEVLAADDSALTAAVGSSDASWVKTLVTDRASRLLPEDRERYLATISSLADHCAISVEGRVEGLPELYRLTATVTLANGSKITMKRLKRVPATAGGAAS